VLPDKALAYSLLRESFIEFFYFLGHKRYATYTVMREGDRQKKRERE